MVSASAPVRSLPGGLLPPQHRKRSIVFRVLFQQTNTQTREKRLAIFRTKLVRGLSDKVKVLKFLNKGAVQLQVAPVFINQPRNQNQSNTEI